MAAEGELHRLTMMGALGFGFLTAIATGLFGILLLIAVMVAADPSELIADPGGAIATFVMLLFAGSILAIFLAVVIGWIPIAIIGWLCARGAVRWPLMRRRTLWAGIGVVAGALSLALASGALEDFVTEPDRYHGEHLRGILAFGGACGVFASLIFWRLTRRTLPMGGPIDLSNRCAYFMRKEDGDEPSDAIRRSEKAD